METGKGFQFVQHAGGLENLGIQFQRSVSGVATGATTGGFLALARMRALSVPRKNLELPLVAALISAWRCRSRFSTGKQ